LVEPQGSADQIPRLHQWVLAYVRKYQFLDSS
jgi:hypothetical protein